MSPTAASTSPVHEPTCVQRGAPSITTRGGLVRIGRFVFRVVQDPAVRSAWRSAGGEIASAIQPAKQAVSAVLVAGRLTAAAWRHCEA